MKILQITYSLTSGGAERLVVDLSNQLSINNEVTLLTVLNDEIGNNGFYKKYLSKNINYICLKENPGFRLKKVINIYKAIKKISPNVVNIHGAGLLYYLSFSILFNRKPRYFETLHTDASDIFYNWKSKLASLFFKFNFIKMITISYNNKIGLEKISNIKNSTLIYNGRSKPEISSEINEVKQEISSLKNSENDIVFIHIGRCSNEKNQKMLIKVFNKLYKQGLGFVLLIIGEGFDTAEGNEIRNMANSNINFLGTKQNVADYLEVSDAFCLSSIFEGMPISLIEAFACACVPICTPTSGSSEFIIDGENGFISKDFSEDAYLQAVERFVKLKSTINPEVLKQTYTSNFSIEKCSNKYEHLYNTHFE